ncbi:Fumarylacetoacetase N-terminal protein [Dioscorea alata]|uniref:Fumarylacetoacetase N-terminal protein n=1 Tax=Dioscorea alata TaxID=55571 RepID=A0ACB7V7Y3_DIOAL|nr:Fumarylacetoacetase N-terminal protein [Dioscorea alata]
MERGGKEDDSWKTEIEKEGASFMASAKEAWLNIRARIIGQIQKAKAKNEKEASEADLQTAKMQVQAADEAEEKKKQLN